MVIKSGAVCEVLGVVNVHCLHPLQAGHPMPTVLHPLEEAPLKNHQADLGTSQLESSPLQGAVPPEQKGLRLSPYLLLLPGWQQLTPFVTDIIPYLLQDVLVSFIMEAQPEFLNLNGLLWMYQHYYKLLHTTMCEGGARVPATTSALWPRFLSKEIVEKLILYTFIFIKCIVYQY